MKRIFLKKIKAFFTYEAAILLPLFAFFSLVFLLLFRALSFQWGLTESVYEASARLALAGDAKLDIGKDRASGDGISAISVGSVFLACSGKIAENDISQKFLENNLSILNYAASEVDDRDIDVKVTISMPLLAGHSFFGKKGYVLGSRVCVRRWNGFDPSNGAKSGGDTVYVTEKGEVYHESLECTYIRLSIHTTSPSFLGTIRSKDGSIYHPCEECGSAISGVCYYTDYGNRAHSSLTCSKLKRTIRAIPRSEAVKRYRPCSKCTGGSADD
ncbi:MAG: hypothetical protein ACI4CS_05245 [Candidatus Weimeria sp.]